jgi:NAD(P)-dependent dehydrogenase (short-subunit alcohol dehydrogenase family)
VARRTWFITGSSGGLGRAWATAALRRGDRVVGTARAPSALDDLVAEHGERMLALPLDVRDRSSVFATVAQAHEHFGELDIVVNSAGYGQQGMVEELTEAEARDQFDTNLFGALWVTQDALPFLRRRGRGHVLQVSSIGGVTAFPGLGIYHASKWALEGLSQALAEEVRAFGIHVTLIEPGAFATGADGAAKHAQPLEAYSHLRQAQSDRRSPDQLGDPVASAEAVLRVVDADPPPLRVFLGRMPLTMVEQDYAGRLATWREWQPVAELAHGG